MLNQLKADWYWFYALWYIPCILFISSINDVINILFVSHFQLLYFQLHTGPSKSEFCNKQKTLTKKKKNTFSEQKLNKGTEFFAQTHVLFHAVIISN